MRKDYFVYILASQKNGTLYIGSTSDLIRRVFEHKQKLIPGFTAKYNVNILVYFEKLDSRIDALHRERRIKKWNRKWKLRLIEEVNPKWEDIYFDLLG